MTKISKLISIILSFSFLCLAAPIGTKDIKNEKDFFNQVQKYINEEEVPSEDQIIREFKIYDGKIRRVIINVLSCEKTHSLKDTQAIIVNEPQRLVNLDFHKGQLKRLQQTIKVHKQTKSEKIIFIQDASFINEYSSDYYLYLNRNKVPLDKIQFVKNKKQEIYVFDVLENVKEDNIHLSTSPYEVLRLLKYFERSPYKNKTITWSSYNDALDNPIIHEKLKLIAREIKLMIEEKIYKKIPLKTAYCH